MLISVKWMFKTEFRPTKKTLLPMKANRARYVDKVQVKYASEICSCDSNAVLGHFLVLGRGETRVFFEHFAKIRPIGAKARLFGKPGYGTVSVLLQQLQCSLDAVT